MAISISKFVNYLRSAKGFGLLDIVVGAALFSVVTGVTFKNLAREQLKIETLGIKNAGMNAGDSLATGVAQHVLKLIKDGKSCDLTQRFNEIQNYLHGAYGAQQIAGNGESNDEHPIEAQELIDACADHANSKCYQLEFAEDSGDSEKVINKTRGVLAVGIDLFDMRQKVIANCDEFLNDRNAGIRINFALVTFKRHKKSWMSVKNSGARFISLLDKNLAEAVLPNISDVPGRSCQDNNDINCFDFQSSQLVRRQYACHSIENHCALDSSQPVSPAPLPTTDPAASGQASATAATGPANGSAVTQLPPIDQSIIALGDPVTGTALDAMNGCPVWTDWCKNVASSTSLLKLTTYDLACGLPGSEYICPKPKACVSEDECQWEE
jgi:hypothetical protein